MDILQLVAERVESATTAASGRTDQQTDPAGGETSGAQQANPIAPQANPVAPQILNRQAVDPPQEEVEPVELDNRPGDNIGPGELENGPADLEGPLPPMRNGFIYVNLF
ncbi:hypothetical protein C0Q70_19461 [Pomacea canaliculata]|uniref:Uncharacterized protein n=1 Tax=Pomacea canaliculata TaxID=400727 RepID=A0A2T7NJE8_POMCA|nr:hypothetical protein C0Q70_19461 [Pomacea canaliculata]